jgi:hypothetical protein
MYCLKKVCQPGVVQSVSQSEMLQDGQRRFDSRQDIFIRHQVRASCRVHTGYGGSFPGIKRPEREANRSPTPNTEVKNVKPLPYQRLVLLPRDTYIKKVDSMGFGIHTARLHY